MPKSRDKIPLERHTLNLFEGEFDRLGDLFPDAGGPGIVIRTLVHETILKVEAQHHVKPSIMKKASQEIKI